MALDGIRGTSATGGGAVGPAALTGLAWCKINWTAESHTHVKVEEGETKLQSATSGIKPVWHEDIPDAEYLPADVWALVLLGSGGGSTLRFAIVTTQADAATGTVGGDVTPGVGEATLYEFGAAVGDDATAGDTVEFENYMRAAVEVNKPVFLTQRSGGIYVAHAEGCEAYPTE